MERGSDRHSARLDEQMAHETQGLVKGNHDTHAEEWKSPEPSGEDQPDVDLYPDGTLDGGLPDGLTDADVEGRSELAVYLHRSVFPAVREMLIDAAMKAEAPDRVVTRVKQLPAGREFHNVGEVWTALGGGHEEHRN